MSTTSIPSSAVHAAPPMGKALGQADHGISTWLSDLVTGAGSSPSHIIITGILGVVPGVGQAMDVRDLILGIIAIAKSPAAIGGWVELVITLIGCVPAAGDALKVGFKLMKQGQNFGRTLEAVSPALRGNVEQFMRKVDWAALAQDCKGLFTKSIAAFIDGLDTSVLKAVAGGSTVKQIVAELKAVQQQGPKMIDKAFAELKGMHTNMMGHALPGSTAAVGATSGKTLSLEARQAAAELAKKQAQAGRTERKLLAHKNRDVTGNRVATNSTSTSIKKKAQPKKQKWNTGVPAEHITDYLVKKKHSNFRKANNGGKLIEETSLMHNGLDHLWSNSTHATKPFVVGETKSSIFDSFRLIAALPAELQQQFAVLRADEAANPTSNNGKPNIFHSEGRDAHANKRVPVGASEADEDAVRRGVNKPGVNKHGESTGLATQMSHKWIARCLEDEQLTVSGRQLLVLIRNYTRDFTFDLSMPRPYQRWVSLVTGRQLEKHRKSGGSTHEVQIILDLPDEILEE